MKLESFRRDLRLPEDLHVWVDSSSRLCLGSTVFLRATLEVQAGLDSPAGV